MSKKLKWYTIKVMPLNEEQEPYEFKVETHNIEWTMEQYARNREGMAWEIIR
tara:strand:- start:406 stop:561 length:156 start_codon:yes stop_codon:yes gene_type:complete